MISPEVFNVVTRHEGSTLKMFVSRGCHSKASLVIACLMTWISYTK